MGPHGGKWKAESFSLDGRWQDTATAGLGLRFYMQKTSYSEDLAVFPTAGVNWQFASRFTRGPDGLALAQFAKPFFGDGCIGWWICRVRVSETRTYFYRLYIWKVELRKVWMLWSRVDHIKHNFWATGQVFSVFTISRILYMYGRDLIQNEKHNI